jgi:hypothetical protein
MPVSDATNPLEAAITAAAPTASIEAPLEWSHEQERLDEQERADMAWERYLTERPTTWRECN